MYIQQLQLKNFRCFEHVKLTFNNRLILITGHNGTGKTSLLEALYFCCYLRSFRTHIIKEMTHWDNGDNSNPFFIKVTLDTVEKDVSNQQEIMVGFSTQRKSVKVNQTAIRSYKELLNVYRIMSLTCDDVDLINGPPEKRRVFLDQALIMYQPDFISHLRHYRTILSQRNALLVSKTFSQESYDLWTYQLWQQTVLIQRHRIEFLELLYKKATDLIAQWFSDTITIDYAYKAKKNSGISFEQFMSHYQDMVILERSMGRSLFGAHLDDFSINFAQKSSKYASRGQQKLVTFFLKIAQMELLIERRGPLILLIDDFMADFDPLRGKMLLEMLINLNLSQIIFTSPGQESYIEHQLLHDKGASIVKLPI